MLGAQPDLYRHTKCLGLSLIFFFFSLAGNITYSASILIPSLEPEHLKVNAAWLVGSAGTLLLDFFVLGQFWVCVVSPLELF